MFTGKIGDLSLSARLWFHALTSGGRAFAYHAWHGRALPNPVVPRSYDDKMLWRKIFDHDSYLTRLTDKLESRRVARERCPDILLPDLLWEGDDIRQLAFDNIDFPVVVKMNNGSGRNVMLRDRDPTAIAAAIDQVEGWHRRPRFGRSRGEWAYRDIKPRVYAERMLIAADGTPPDEYKLHMCDGELAQMMVIHDRWGDKCLIDYDGDAKRMDFDHPGWSQDYDPTDLDLIEEILDIARALSSGVDYVRVDLYVHYRKIYFGEYTLYPSSGFGSSRSLNPMRGEKWDIRRSGFFANNSPASRRYLEFISRRYETGP